jgi:hypothetical protein
MVRTATPADVPAIFSLIQDLANYERAPEQVVNTPAQLQIESLVLRSFTLPTPPGKAAAFIWKIFMSLMPKESKDTDKHYLMK